MKIILGSQSKARKEVLERMGVSFEIMSADIDEKSIRREDAKELTMAIARAKADVLLRDIQEPAILITADTVNVCNRKIREKAETLEQAADFLREYAVHPLQTVTAVVVTNTTTHEQKEGVDIVDVWFRSIPEEVIRSMVSRPDITSFAGAFAFQDPLQREYVDHFEGEEESILGLPKALTLFLLKEIGAIDLLINNLS